MDLTNYIIKNLIAPEDSISLGRETNPNQIPITHEDLKRVPDVLSDYDEIIAGKGIKDGKHHDAVIFRKNMMTEQFVV